MGTKNVLRVWATKAKMERRAVCRSKVTYLSFSDASLESIRIARSLKLKFRQTPYVCQVCGNYHLTSKR